MLPSPATTSSDSDGEWQPSGPDLGDTLVRLMTARGLQGVWRRMQPVPPAAPLDRGMRLQLLRLLVRLPASVCSPTFAAVQRAAGAMRSEERDDQRTAARLARELSRVRVRQWRRAATLRMLEDTVRPDELRAMQWVASPAATEAPDAPEIAPWVSADGVLSAHDVRR